MSEQQPPISMTDLFEKFVASLPEGHRLTGFTFEISSNIGKGHLVRCNGGTYAELIAEFKGSTEDFVTEMLKGYMESHKLAVEKFTPVVAQAEGSSDDTQANPAQG